MVLNKEFKVKFKGRTFVINDYDVCDTLYSKFRGLMFRRKDYKKPLLFVFNKPSRYSIHSFFCEDFLAVWMLKQGARIGIIDEKIIKPYKISVTPQEKFNILLEVPLRYFEFADGDKKI